MQKGDDEGGGTLILDIFEFLSEPFRLKFVAGVEELVSNESRGGKWKFNMKYSVNKSEKYNLIQHIEQLHDITYHNTTKSICHQKPGN